MKFHVFVRNAYFGTVDTTKDELLAALPYSELRGNCLDVFAPPLLRFPSPAIARVLYPSAVSTMKGASQ